MHVVDMPGTTVNFIRILTLSGDKSLNQEIKNEKYTLDAFACE